ncbi:hypothetical protein AVEN_126562-1 [Araneus ventricosus]|uniref:Uncharacterized protein n=1 Tax=Araneus ventricosus TaxID=182803 RepID=A0A4Y2LGX4_ARAVE|nr:hypothetical protein AVEN_126562-1 [Araneus ventricosus]
MMRATSELAPPLQASAPHQREDVWPPTYDLTSNRPNTQRIFSGIKFRTWNPSALRPTPYHLTTVFVENVYAIKLHKFEVGVSFFLHFSLSNESILYYYGLLDFRVEIGELSKIALHFQSTITILI